MTEEKINEILKLSKKWYVAPEILKKLKELKKSDEIGDKK